MAKPISFPEADGSEDFLPPHEFRPLPVKHHAKSTTSCWQLSEEEKAEIAKTGVIWLVTSTYKQLDPAPEGEVWQPPVYVKTSKVDALNGW